MWMVLGGNRQHQSGWQFQTDHSQYTEHINDLHIFPRSVCYLVWRIILTQIYEVHDSLYGNTGASVGSLEIDSGVSCTSNGSYITITKNTSGEKYVKLPITTPNGDWEFSSEIAELGTTQYVTFMMDNAQYWGTISNEGVFVNLKDSTSSYSHTASVGDVLRLRYVNGVLSVYVNDTQLKTKTVSISNVNIGYYTNQGRVQKIKNIMLKPL